MIPGNICQCVSPVRQDTRVVSVASLDAPSERCGRYAKSDRLEAPSSGVSVVPFGSPRNTEVFRIIVPREEGIDLRGFDTRTRK